MIAAWEGYGSSGRLYNGLLSVTVQQNKQLNGLVWSGEDLERIGGEQQRQVL